jgi:C_GCAxxG_C_C family probable redox protein
MTKHESIASELFRGGANCAQSVFAAFAEELGIDRDYALRLSSPFGGGMGRMREVCGAVSGMLMVLGQLEGYAAHDGEAKAALYTRVQSLMRAFEAEKGSYICRELLKTAGPEEPIPARRDDAYYNSRPCEGCIKFAAALVDEYILTGKELPE